jgi:hypothetical protein
VRRPHVLAIAPTQSRAALLSLPLFLHAIRESRMPLSQPASF